MSHDMCMHVGRNHSRSSFFTAKWQLQRSVARILLFFCMKHSTIHNMYTTARSNDGRPRSPVLAMYTLLFTCPTVSLEKSDTHSCRAPWNLPAGSPLCSRPVPRDRDARDRPQFVTDALRADPRLQTGSSSWLTIHEFVTDERVSPHQVCPHSLLPLTTGIQLDHRNTFSCVCGNVDQVPRIRTGGMHFAAVLGTRRLHLYACMYHVHASFCPCIIFVCMHHVCVHASFLSMHHFLCMHKMS